MKTSQYCKITAAAVLVAFATVAGEAHAAQCGNSAGGFEGWKREFAPEARAKGIGASGPFPADTLFTPRVLATGDAALAMFHDQGLPVLKHAAFGEAVNVTLGLPIIRTSVDHGTALDRAGKGEVDAGSFRAAIALALGMAARGRA